MGKEETRSTEQKPQSNEDKRGILSFIETHPVLSSLSGIVIGAIISGIFLYFLGEVGAVKVSSELTKEAERAAFYIDQTVESRTDEIKTRAVRDAISEIDGDPIEVEVTRIVEVTPEVAGPPIEVTRIVEVEVPNEVTRIVTSTSAPPTNTPETPTAPLGDTGFTYTPSNSSVDGVTFELKSVEIFANRMRLTIEIWNQAPTDETISFRSSLSVLIDDLGNEYNLLSTNAPIVEGSGPETAIIRSGVKQDYWFEFPAPIDGAKNFNVRLLGSPQNTNIIHFSEFSMQLDY